MSLLQTGIIFTLGEKKIPLSFGTPQTALQAKDGTENLQKIT